MDVISAVTSPPLLETALTLSINRNGIVISDEISIYTEALLLQG